MKIRYLCFLVFIIACVQIYAVRSIDNILIISSYDAGNEKEKLLWDEINRELNKEYPHTQLYYESLDTDRVSLSDKQMQLYLKDKYDTIDLSCVIALEEPAFAFFLKYNYQLWPEIPILFCGVQKIHEDIKKLFPNFSGVEDRIAYAETMLFLKKIIPNLSEVYIFGDTSLDYKMNKLAFTEEMQPYDEGFNYHYIENHNLSLFKSLSEQLKPGAVILLFSSLHTDSLSVNKKHTRSAEVLFPKSTVPLIAFEDYWLGHGVLGASFLRSSSQAFYLVQLINRYANGEEISDINFIKKAQLEIVVDYQKIKKYHLIASDFPKNTVFINLPKSDYSIKKFLVWLTLFAIFSVFLILTYMVYLHFKAKKAENKLHENLAFMETLINTIPNPIYFTDLSGIYLLCNQSFCEMFQFAKESIIGSKITSLIPHKYAKLLKESDKRLLSQPPVQRFECTLYEKEANEKSLVFNKALIYDSKATIQGIVGVISDITEQKKSTRIIQQHIQALRDKNNEMEALVHSVSHDLKSPILTIKGFLAYAISDLNKGDMEKVQRDFNRISNAADKMEELLDDLLRLARLSSTATPRSHFSMSEVVKDAIDMLQSRINEKEVIITYKEKMPFVFGDKKRIREVWQNLIENAIKYAKPNGHPVIQIGYEQMKNYPVFFIKDHGIGIPKEAHEKVFGLFEKLNNDTEGSGIGLALVRKIIDIHHGKIWIEPSELGTLFKFYLNLNE